MLERFVGPFLASLKERRFARASIAIARYVTVEFVLYMAGRGRPGSKPITRDHVSAYLDARARVFLTVHRRRMLDDYRVRLENPVMHFLSFVKGKGVPVRLAAPPAEKLGPRPEDERLLADFERFLRDHRGNTPSTVKGYRDHAWRLCRWMSEAGGRSWDQLTPEVLLRHIRREGRRLGHISLGNAITGIRTFLRFLRMKGVLRANTDAWLIRPRRWRLGRVPEAVSLSDLKKIFRDVRGGSPSDLRDRLVFLLLAFYGLRIGDIARIKLEDVRWREGKLVVLQQKTKQLLTLPLHPGVGEAIWDYVSRVRPRGTPYRELFLTLRNPAPYSLPSALGATIKSRLEVLGIRTHPHAFRHAFASRLLNNGCPPTWIQILLGHRNPETTEVYSKVNLVGLKEVSENGAGDL